MTTSAATKYQLDGRLLEVCTCEVICPCWVGADPDGGTCDSALGWHIDTGTIQGVDVSGLTIPLEIALYVTSCSKCRYFHGLWCATGA